MSYTAPLGNVVDFTTTGAIYVPTPGGAVDFNLYGVTTYIAGSGKAALSGSAATAHGASSVGSGQAALSGSAAVVFPFTSIANGIAALYGAAVVEVAAGAAGEGVASLSGYCDLIFEPPHFDAVGRGNVTLTGIAYDTGFLAVGAGAYALGPGLALGYRGNNAIGAGKLITHGGASGAYGGAAYGAGKLGVTGSATFKHGRSMYGAGSFSLSGGAVAAHRQAQTIYGIGYLALSGMGDIAQPVDIPNVELFCQRRDEVIYALL